MPTETWNLCMEIVSTKFNLNEVSQQDKAIEYWSTFKLKVFKASGSNNHNVMFYILKCYV